MKLIKESIDLEEAEYDEEEFENTIGASSMKDAKEWLDARLEEYGNTYNFSREDKRELDRLISDFGNTYFWGRVNESLKEDYENSPYYNITYKVADGIFSTLIVKASSEEEAKEIFDKRQPDYADAVIGNRKISTEEAEGLLKKGMSLFENLNEAVLTDKDEFYVDQTLMTKPKFLKYLEDNNLYIFNKGNGDYTVGKSKKDKSQIIKWILADELKKDERFKKYFIEENKESNQYNHPEVVITEFNCTVNSNQEDSIRKTLNDDYDVILLNFEKIKSLTDGKQAVLIKVKGKLNNIIDYLIDNGASEAKIDKVIKDSTKVTESLSEEFKSKEDALAYLKEQSKDPEKAEFIKAILQLLADPKEESLNEDVNNYVESQKLLKKIGEIAGKYNCEIWDFEDINHFKVQGSLKDINKFEKEFQDTFKDQLNEDAQIDKIEIEVEAPEKEKSEEEEIADTPNPPEAGINVFIANTLGDLIVGEWDTIKDYNNFMNELITNQASADILNVIKDIVAEEHEHIGQLQQALKTVAPNAINLAAGEEEGSKQIAAPVDIGDPSVDGDKPTEKELEDDALLSPEEAKEKEDE